MNPIDNKTTPGCFGAASVFDENYAVCQSCAAFRTCGEAARSNLQAMRERIDLSAVMTRRVQVRSAAMRAGAAPVVSRQASAIPEEDQRVIALISDKNRKAGEQATLLCKYNKINLCRAALPNRVNPFAESGPSFMRVACDLLLNGGFTKAMLKQRLMTVLGWSPGTAAAHGSMATALLYAFGIATLAQEQFVLNPALG